MISIRRKAIFLFFIIVSIVALVVFDAVAMDYRIFSDQIQAEAGKSITIPLKIENNKGIMGFKLTANYSNSIFKEPKVMRGSVTSVGMLSDSIQESTIDSFDVVWSNSENVYADGVLLVLQFTLDKKVSNGLYAIDLTFSQPDTFNEQWDDIPLDISNITVQVGQPTESSLLTQNEESTQEHPSTICVFDDQTDVEVVLEVIDSHFVQNEIENQLLEAGVASIDDLSEEQYSDFQEEISDAFGLYDVTIVPENLRKDSYSTLYQAAVVTSFVDDVLESADADAIQQAIESTMNEYGIGTLEDIPEDRAVNFSRDVQEKLESYGAEFESLPKGGNPIAAIEKLQAQIIADNSQTYNRKLKNWALLLLIILAVVGIVFLPILFLMKKRKRIKYT